MIRFVRLLHPAVSPAVWSLAFVLFAQNAVADDRLADILDQIPLPSGVALEARQLDRDNPSQLDRRGRYTQALITHGWHRIEEYDEGEGIPPSLRYIRVDDGESARAYQSDSRTGEVRASRIPRDAAIGFEPTLSPVAVMRHMVEYVLPERKDDVRINASGDRIVLRTGGDRDRSAGPVELEIDAADFTIRRVSLFSDRDATEPTLVYLYDEWGPLDDDPDGHDSLLHPRLTVMHNVQRDHVVRRNRIVSVMAIPLASRPEPFEFPEGVRIHDRIEGVVHMPDGSVVEPPEPPRRPQRQARSEPDSGESEEQPVPSPTGPGWGWQRTWPLAALGVALIVGALVYRVRRG